MPKCRSFPRPARLACLAASLSLALTLAPSAPRAQQAVTKPPAASTVPAPQPVESQPLPPLAPAPAEAAQAPASPVPASPVPAPPVPAAPAPIAPSPAAPQAQSAPAPGNVPLPQLGDGPATLAPPPSDPSIPDTVDIASKPSVALRAMSSWDDGYDNLTRAFQRLQDEMTRAGIKVTGRPISVFLETDDMGFRFEAQLPIESAPSTRPATLPQEITFGSTPSGRAIRFVHRGPYDDIDSTYEAISAYLDSKGIEVKDSFTEEYVNAGANAGDTALEMYIYVLPK
jgi:effector-binding domain-containing protein